jgi:hypothetical protein
MEFCCLPSGMAKFVKLERVKARMPPKGRNDTPRTRTKDCTGVVALPRRTIGYVARGRRHCSTLLIPQMDCKYRATIRLGRRPFPSSALLDSSCRGSPASRLLRLGDSASARFGRNPKLTSISSPEIVSCRPRTGARSGKPGVVTEGGGWESHYNI